ncbi:MAG: hypothetical protein K1000chlam3_01639 [Chlamydiae bacterium]|nr:hypothetical protein [Chlamydiota bacterium]
MMKSEIISPLLLKRIDELIRINYSFLEEEDEIYFLGEYTPGAKSAHSKINRLIINYKKSVTKRGLPEYYYKEQSISSAAQLFRDAILNTIDLSDRITHTTLVPVPPSMAKDSQEYDDRNLKMLEAFMPNGDIRELYLQKKTRPPLHALKSSPRNPNDLFSNYTLNEKVLLPKPKEIWLFDDVLRKGTHFRAAYMFLKERFRDIPIVGFYIARSIFKISQ